MKTVRKILTTGTATVLGFSLVAGLQAEQQSEAGQAAPPAEEEEEREFGQPQDRPGVQQPGERPDRPGVTPDRPGRPEATGELNIHRSSELEGSRVENHEEERLGNVDSLALDLETGELGYIVVSAGGFLGIGDELKLVPPDAAEIEFEDGVLMEGLIVRIDISEEEWEQAPSIEDREQITEYVETDRSREVYQHFGVQWEDRAAIEFGAPDREREQERPDEPGMERPDREIDVPGIDERDDDQAKQQIQQQIEQAMTRAGVDQEDARDKAEELAGELAEESPDQQEVQQKVQDALTEAGVDQMQAQQEAQQLASRIQQHLENGIEFGAPDREQDKESAPRHEQPETAPQREDYGDREGQAGAERPGARQAEEGERPESAEREDEPGIGIEAEEEREVEFGAREQQELTDLKLSAELDGQEIVGAEEEEIGQVDDFLVDVGNGRVPFVLVTPDTDFWEAAEESYAIPPQAFEALDDERLQVRITQQELEQAEGLTAANIHTHAREHAMAERGQLRESPQVFRFDEGEEDAIFGRPDRERDADEDEDGLFDQEDEDDTRWGEEEEREQRSPGGDRQTY